jgi:hypothetical protein
MTDSMTSIDRMTGAATTVVLIAIAYWAGVSDWRLSLVGLAAMASYQLAWVRGRQSTTSATN